MADEIHYDYQSMEQAYENMMRISNNIQSSCEDMTSDAMRLLQSSGGTYAEEYHKRVEVLNSEIQDLNEKMSIRARDLQEMFNRMREADQRLGAGF